MQSDATMNSNPAGLAAGTIAAIAAATLGGAWFFEYVLGIKPCPMCLEQRYAYYLVIVLGIVLALGASRLPRTLAIAVLAVLAVAAFGNAIYGAFHAGVEWQRGGAGSRQCQRPAEADGDREGHPLRRGAVALPRHLARRVQFPDLGPDGAGRPVRDFAHAGRGLGPPGPSRNAGFQQCFRYVCVGIRVQPIVTSA
jgi:hypothetical protein